jgi:excisionase family DNA binding protein
MSEDELSVSEAAQRLGVAEKTVRRWIKAGKLPARLVEGPYGPTYRVPAEAIQTAQQIVDVVRVERPTDPQTLALAIVQGLSTALEKREAAEQKALEDLQKALEAQQQQTAAALERLAREQERRDDELRAWLERRLPPAEAKRMGMVARLKRMLGK